MSLLYWSQNLQLYQYRVSVGVTYQKHLTLRVLLCYIPLREVKLCLLQFKHLLARKLNVISSGDSSDQGMAISQLFSPLLMNCDFCWHSLHCHTFSMRHHELVQNAGVLRLCEKLKLRLIINHLPLSNQAEINIFCCYNKLREVTVSMHQFVLTHYSFLIKTLYSFWRSVSMIGG